MQLGKGTRIPYIPNNAMMVLERILGLPQEGSYEELTALLQPLAELRDSTADDWLDRLYMPSSQA